MMSKAKQLFILQNQDKYFLSKNNEWVDGTDLKGLFKTPHRDIAVNQLFEVNSHDYTQRIQVLDCPSEGRNDPVIAPELMPPPLPKKPNSEPSPADEAGNDDQAVDGENSSDDAPSRCDEESVAAVEPEEELLVHEV